MVMDGKGVGGKNIPLSEFVLKKILHVGIFEWFVKFV